MFNDMKLYSTIYTGYRTALWRTIRLLIFSLLIFLIVYQILGQYLNPRLVFFFNLALMVELFFRYKIGRIVPTATVIDSKDILQSFTLAALSEFRGKVNTPKLIKSLINYPQIKKFLEKANIAVNEVKLIEVKKEDLSVHAVEIARMHNGKFVTILDLFIAYLALTEKETKLLFNKQLKELDITAIAVWLRREFFQEEYPEKVRVKFWGSGIGEAMVYGWTYETKKYADNFTTYALQEEPVIFGREKEFRAILEGLIKLENNNVLLVGDIGSGKENLVRSLAYQSFTGALGGWLSHRRVYQLLVGPLTAGVSNRGDLEVRLESIITEISHSGDVILYIPDFQNIVGATSYNLDLSGVLIPYLKTGNMPVVATMMQGSFKTFMERNPLKEAFTVIHLNPPDKQIAIQMALTEVKKLEQKYGVILSFLSIKKAVDLAERFVQEAVLPGSAISLLETTANTVSLSSNTPYFDKTKKKIVLEGQVIRQVEMTTNVPIGTPTQSEADLLLHLEDKIHERLIDQQEAVTAISEAMRRVRSGMQEQERPISFLFLGPTGVGKTETAKALASIYYGGEKNMIRLDMSEYTDETGLKRLLGAPPGEGEERGELTDKIHDHPSSMILLDEFEKAHPKIHNLFLQVLEDGRLTDNKGVTVSFRNSIIIATSNAGSEFIREEVEKGTVINKVFQHQLLNYLQLHAIFKPELLNRFDDVVTFKPLGAAEVNQVVKLMLKSLTKTLAEQDITLVVDDKVLAKIANEGFDRDFGARPLRRYIQDNLEDLIAQKKLTNEITRGKTVTFSVDALVKLQITIS
ncbi:ATP-dependent Clp protease ATP-binding subunit [Candidatus Roizmanbacteria bacterium]|nr:ATP-dependent Clp protease ATP-binding subunit [Candidatus Roizmanbacteria bacterium]